MHKKRPSGVLSSPIDSLFKRMEHTTDTVVTVFEKQVEKTPHHVALVSNQETLTYKALNQRANQMAHYLLSLGVKREVVVMLYLKKSPQAIITLLAVLKSGGAYLPLDYSLPDQSIQYIADESKATFLIAQSIEQTPNLSGPVRSLVLDQLSAFLEKQATTNPQAGCCYQMMCEYPTELESRRVREGEYFIFEQSAEGWFLHACSIHSKYFRKRITHSKQTTRLDQLAQQRMLQREKKIIVQDPSETAVLNGIATSLGSCTPTYLKTDNLAYIIYTSGSTGHPKGVEIEHMGITNLIMAHIAVFQMSPCSRALLFSSLHFDASISEIFSALLSGATLYLPADELRTNPQGLSNYLVQNKINVASIPPVLLSRMPKTEYTSLKTLVIAGDICPKEVMDYWLTQCRVINGYGPTESTVGPTLCLYDGILHRSIGHSIPNVNCYVLNKQQERVLPGDIGELHISGIGLARGYRGQPELTRKKFIHWLDKESGGSTVRLYKTGDLVKLLANGDMEYIGRTDFQIKFHGVRIDPFEIEIFLNQHASIQKSLVMLKKSNKEEYLTAYLLLKKNHSLPSGEIHNYLNQFLPSIKIPNAFVFLESFPLLSSGKVDRQALPVPRLKYENDTPCSTPPKKDHWLTKIWGKILSLECDSITEDSHFFSLGGTSLHATELALEIEKIKKIQIKSLDIFENPTFKCLLSRISSLTKRADEIPLAPIKTPYCFPLSCSQKRLWLSYQIMRKKVPASYNLSLILKLNGDLDWQLMQEALQHLVDRHASLRTYFPSVDIQRVGEFKVALEKISLIDRLMNSNSLQKYISETAKHDFGDLSILPLMRSVLLEVEKEKFILILIFHHIIIDAASIPILIRDLSKTYNALHNEAPLPLKALPIQYTDFSVWEKKCSSSGQHNKSLEYWKSKLQGADPSLTFLACRPRPKESTYRGKVEVFYFTSSLTRNLKTLAKQKKLTLFTLIFSSLSVLLYRYTHQEDLMIGVICGERPHPLLNQLIGFFVNILPIRIYQSDALSFVDVLNQVQQALSEALKHNVPLEKIIDQIKLPRYPGCHPLFQVSINMHQPTLFDDVDFAGLDTSFSHHSLIKASHLESAKFDLDFDIELLADERLAIKITYATELFDEPIISNIAKHWTTLCENIVKNPTATISTLSILKAAEKRNLLKQWSPQKTCRTPQDDTILSLFEEQVEKRPNAIAILHQKKKMSYQELNDISNQLARHLQDIQDLSESENIIAVALEGSSEYILSLLAILKTGSAYLPLDPTLPVKRLQFILEDSAAKVLITSEKWREKFNSLDLPVLFIDDANTLEKIALQGRNNLDEPIRPNGLAYVIYTSGSTGKPKGVMIEHHSVARLAKNNSYIQITPDDIVAQVCSITFDVSGFEIWGALLNGAKIVICLNATLLCEAEFHQTIIEQKISILVLTTALFYRFLSLNLHMFCTVKWLIFIGEKLLNTEILRQLYCHPEAAPQHLLNVYGPTESTIFATAYECNPQAVIGDNLPIGHPIDGTSAYVLDDQLQPVPEGILGELCLGGVGLARGYLNRDSLTQERFISNPFLNDHSRLYRTGDLVYYQKDNALVFVKRTDQQIKLLGYRIEITEIETTLLSCSNVKEVVVTLQDTRDYKQLVAYIVLAEQQDCTQFEQQLRAELADLLPYYMIPAKFVVLDAFPLNANGKTDRQRLPPPDFHHTKGYIAASTPIERALVVLWGEVLHLNQAIGVTDNFFLLGGNSLLAMQLTSLINRKFAAVTYSALFAQPTIQSQAKLIEVPEQQKRKMTQDIDYFKEEALLPEDVKLSDQEQPPYPESPKAIFLTGVTGFLGVFLLDKLLQSTDAHFFCLIRADTVAQANSRFFDTLQTYRLDRLVQQSNKRIHLVVGDVSEPYLGLKKEEYDKLSAMVDLIYHSASEVNFLKPYSALKRSNVIGTRNMLRFSIHRKVKPLHYMSSASVFSFAHYFGDHSLLEEHALNWSSHLAQALPRDLGYVQSKTVAETMVCSAIDRGIPVIVYRLGFILCDSHTGVGNADQLWARLIKDCYRLGCYPSFRNIKGEFITVDYAVQAIAKIAEQPACTGKIFHIVPSRENNIDSNDLFSRVILESCPLEEVPLSAWSERLHCFIEEGHDSALKLLLPLFTDPVVEGHNLFEVYQDSPDFSVSNTRQALEGSGVVERPITASIMSRFLLYVLETTPTSSVV